MGASHLHHRLFRIDVFIVLLTCAVVAVGGCASDEAYDAKLRDVIREQSAILGRETLAPTRDMAGVTLGKHPDPDSLQKNPPSTNPAADDLPFLPNSESRDVAARLEQYARDVLGEAAAGITTPASDSLNPDAPPDAGSGSGPSGSGAAGAATGANAGAPTAVGGSPADAASSAGADISGITRPAEPPRAREPFLSLDLEGTFRLAQRSAREFKTSEEEYVLAAIRLLIERHRWGPRLFNDTSVVASGNGTDGSYQSAVDLINELRVTQRLPAGGELEARWVWNATEHLREQATGRYRQSSAIVLNGNIPLLRGAGDVAQEDLIQAERDLVYQSRTFERSRRILLVSIASDYFDLVQTRSQIANQVQQIESLREFERQTQALVDAGRKAQFDLNDARNRVLSGVASLANLREQYILQLDRFRVRLGLSLDSMVDVQPITLELPEPDTTIAAATRAALEYRLDLQNQRDQVSDARRAVGNARNNLLPNLDLNGNVNIPTDPDAREGGAAFDPEDLSYTAGVTFGLPLDREIERLQVRQSIIRYEQTQRLYERFRDEVVVAVRAALRGIDLARFQLQLAEQQVKITEQRREEQLLKSDELDTRKRLEAEEDLLTARNNRDKAKTDLRVAILNYLLASDQLRVARDGTFQPLAGMFKPGDGARAGTSTPQSAPPASSEVSR